MDKFQRCEQNRMTPYENIWNEMKPYGCFQKKGYPKMDGL